VPEEHSTTLTVILIFSVLKPTETVYTKRSMYQTTDFVMSILFRMI